MKGAMGEGWFLEGVDWSPIRRGKASGRGLEKAEYCTCVGFILLKRKPMSWCSLDVGGWGHDATMTTNEEPESRAKGHLPGVHN